MTLNLLKEAILRFPEKVEKDLYADLRELIDELIDMPNYAESVTMRETPSIKVKNDEVKCMELGHIVCYEEDSVSINRVNKFREIEKEFTAKRIQSVLLSNKETRKAVKERSGLTKLLMFHILTILLYVALPLVLIIVAYFLAKDVLHTSINVADYISEHFKFSHECSEVYNNLVLGSFIQRYVAL